MIRKRKLTTGSKKQKTPCASKISRSTKICHAKKGFSHKRIIASAPHSFMRTQARKGMMMRVDPREVRSIGSQMHPFMRTMFLSLAIGTVGVFASMAYYIHIAHATEPFLFQDASGRMTAETALRSVDGTFTGLIQDLEKQRTNAGGALPILPKEYLRLRAEQVGVGYELLNHIAYCESHWRMVQNKKSTAFGYYQILDGTERLTPQYRQGLRKTDPYVNIDMAIWLFQKYGTTPWVESQSCWSSK
jgi:hypothetical protein